MSRENNPITNILAVLSEKIEELAWDARRDLEKETYKLGKMEKDLIALTEEILGGVDKFELVNVFELEDDEREELEKSAKWVEAYENFYFYDEKYKISKKAQNLLERAANDLVELGHS